MAITKHGDYVYGKIDYSGLYWIYNAENISPATDDGWWFKEIN